MLERVFPHARPAPLGNAAGIGFVRMSLWSGKDLLLYVVICTVWHQKQLHDYALRSCGIF